MDVQDLCQDVLSVLGTLVCLALAPAVISFVSYYLKSVIGRIAIGSLKEAKKYGLEDQISIWTGKE